MEKAFKRSQLCYPVDYKLSGVLAMIKKITGCTRCRSSLQIPPCLLPQAAVNTRRKWESWLEKSRWVAVARPLELVSSYYHNRSRVQQSWRRSGSFRDSKELLGSALAPLEDTVSALGATLAYLFI
jgi:hypothetical protein